MPSASETMAMDVTKGVPTSVRMANVRLRMRRWTSQGAAPFTQILTRLRLRHVLGTLDDSDEPAGEVARGGLVFEFRIAGPPTLAVTGGVAIIDSPLTA